MHICQQDKEFSKQLNYLKNYLSKMHGLTLLAEYSVYNLKQEGMCSPLYCLTGISGVDQMQIASGQCTTLLMEWR